MMTDKTCKVGCEMCGWKGKRADPKSGKECPSCGSGWISERPVPPAFRDRKHPLKPMGANRTMKSENNRVLDPCCGSRMMWFDRGHPDVTFGDIREETITVTDRSHGNKNGTRTLRIEPDTLMDFRDLPYDDGSFKLIAFDPPHLERAGPKSWLAAKYGKLSENWRDDLEQGFAECFRVLDVDGVLIFKWNETQVKVREVLALTPIQPLFGHPSGRKGLTHWMVFMKPSPKENEDGN